MDRYSNEQKQIHDYIKSLHDEGYGYRKIYKILNDKGIKTHKGNKFLNTNVYSVLKRYKDRDQRLEIINQNYESEWGRFTIKKLKD